MVTGKLTQLYTDGKRVEDAAARDAAVLSLTASFDGDIALAGKLLPKAVGDPVLGTLAVNMFYGASYEEEPLKEALLQLGRRYPVRDTTFPRIDEPLRNNYLVGQSGSPLKYEKGEIIPLDATVYKLAALDTLKRLKGYPDEADNSGSSAAYDDLCNKFNLKFYDKKTGVYRAVRKDGGFSPFTNVASLLPLFSGAVKDKERIWSVLRLYLDKNKFNLKNGVPVIPADSPYFGREFLDYNGVESGKFASFSGGVYPEFSILTYFGLIRAGADGLASELAAKMEAAFEKEFEKDGGALPRFYSPDGKFKIEEKTEKSSEALLMALAARYDRCGTELFASRKELRFSTALWKNGESQAVYFCGERIKFSFDGKNISATKDGENVIKSEVSGKGALVVRKLRKERFGLSFIVDSPASGTKITFDGRLFGGKGRITAELPEGKSAVVIDFDSRASEVRRFNGRE